MYPSTRSVFPATDVCMAIHTFCGFPHDNGALRFLHAPPRIANCGHTPMYVWPYIRSMAFHTITVPSASSMTPREFPTAATREWLPTLPPILWLVANCGQTPMYVWPYIRSVAFHTITVPSASSMTPRESPTAATPRCMHGHTYVPWLSTRYRCPPLPP